MTIRRMLAIGLAGATVAFTAGCSATVAGTPSAATANVSAADPTGADPGGADLPGFTKKVFDHVKVEAAVQTILTASAPAGYGLTGISAVSCPAEAPVTTGTVFDCTVQIAGSRKFVTITVLSDDGQYQIGVPSDTPSSPTTAQPTN